MDICRLSVMSGLEIDKAKKELNNINIASELKQLKDKYNDQDRPKFFEHLDKGKEQKSKKNQNNKGEEQKPENNRSYKEYKTSMDKLYRMIKGKHLESCKAAGELSKLFSGYMDIRKVNMEQADEIINACTERCNENRYINQADYSNDKNEKYEKIQMADEDLINEFKGICKKKVGKNTIRYCITEMGMLEQGNTLIEYMIMALLKCKPEAVINLLEEKF